MLLEVQNLIWILQKEWIADIVELLVAPIWFLAKNFYFDIDVFEKLAELKKVGR